MQEFLFDYFVNFQDDWDDGDNYGNQDGREKSRSRGPPRMRRGGSQAQSGNRNNAFRDQPSHEELQTGIQSRGSGPRRGDPSARRGAPGGGGVSRGGGRAFQSRQPKPELQSGPGAGAFSGSIDTWNNPPSISGSGAVSAGVGAGPDRSGSSGGSTSGAPATTAAPGGPAGPAGPKRAPRNSGGKDAFDNAGNWGDDFPAADDWDNEEYTGSLADTKVFTARSTIGPNKAAAPGGGQPQQQPQVPQSQQQQQQQQPAPNTTVIGQNRSFSSATVNGPPIASAPPTSSVSSYSQSIDLSTLLQKPTTQSSLSSPPSQQQQSLLQFNQQGTDTLRAGLGIGQNNSSKAPGNLTSYAAYAQSASAFSSNQQSSNSYAVGQGSAFTSIKPQSPSSNGSANGPSGLRTSAPPPSKGPAPSSGMPSAAVASTQARSRMPPSSKIPSSAVEMPGDNVTQLDVQFGGLDLKFGSGSNDASGMGGFEFTSSNDDQTSKYLSEKTSKPVAPSTGLYQVNITC